MTKYAFTESFTPLRGFKDADAQKAGEALEKIRREHKGELKPRDVVAAARASASNYLHRFFDWNVERAALAHWIDEARVLIRAVRVVVDDDSRPAFLSVNVASDGEPYHVSYRRLADVLDSTEFRLAVWRQAERDLRAWQERYRELREIVDLVGPALTELRRRIDDEDRPSA